MKFGSLALKVKRKNFIDIIVTGPDRINVFVYLVSEKDELVRRVFYDEFEAVNGAIATNAVLFIPTFDLGALPGSFKWKVSADNFERASHFHSFYNPTIYFSKASS
jgi:hypothetical protein